MANLKKNLGYQTLYQILNICLPLITAPFLARVLGAESLGIMSYTGSVVHYFTLFSMMGLVNYGTRSIAVVKDDVIKRNNVFSQIFYMQLFATSIAFISYGIYLFVFCKDNVLVSCIQGIAVISCFFDINWFFFGIEEFKLTVIRGIFIRVITVALMLVLIKSPADLWIYAVLLIGSNLISQIVLWFYVPRFLKLVKPNFTTIKSHFVPNIKLFIPILAMSVYHIMDKTMLGALSDYIQSGYYYNADKVINIPIGILMGIGTVMLPRMSTLAGEKKKEEMDSLFNSSIRAIAFVSAAMCCGIAAIASEFTPFFFGQGYDDCVILIIVLAPVLFIKGLSLVSRNLYLIPNKLENKLTASVVAGAVVNLVVNLIFIPPLGALGAVIGTLTAEFVSCVWQYVAIAKDVKCIRSIFSGFTYFGLGVLMFIGVRFIAASLTTNLFLKVIIEIISGICIYGFLSIVYWLITKNFVALNYIKSQLRRNS